MNADNTLRKMEIINGLTVLGGTTVKAEYLAIGAGIIETDKTYPKTRALIRELIDEGYCIGSKSTGYYLMQTGKEIQIYLNSLLQRQIAISNRIAAVYHAGKDAGLI